MARNRRSSRSPDVARTALVIASTLTLSAIALVACGGGEAARPVAPTPPPADSAPPARRPDGVVIDLPHALPVAQDRAKASGVIALREPLSKEVVFRVVRTYADAFLKEDPESLQGLLASDASWIVPPGAPPPNAGILEQWHARMRNFDYTKLAGAEIVRADHVEIRTYDELKDARPPHMRPDDIYVRAAIQTSHVGTDALFPERVNMVLRRDRDRYVIAGIEEDFSP